MIRLQVLRKTSEYTPWQEIPASSFNIGTSVTTPTLLAFSTIPGPTLYHLALPGHKFYHDISRLAPYQTDTASSIRHMIDIFTEQEVISEHWVATNSTKLDIS